MADCGRNKPRHSHGTTLDTIETILALNENELLARGTLLHAAGSITNADTFVVDIAESRILVKSLKRRFWLVRVLFARKTLRHECHVLDQLHDIEGIPKLHGMVGKDTLLMEYVEGNGPLGDSREIEPDQWPPKEFFVRLRTLVDTMHQRGISHGDMRRRNIMQGPDNQPYLIDFATAVSLQGPFGSFRRGLFTMCRRADRFALAKMIRSYYPDVLNDDDERALRDIPWYLRLGRFLRKRVYRRFIKQKRWRERWIKFLEKLRGKPSA